ncbi:DUF5655 domain-containing protein [Tahibacter amnicola]|uniref:DUF5655 domain-containing protein n=1 Tax=Tahibacter amnicola TaxID=2976241 RepID=A0ABY6B8V9_9GAMM|nr:DUF5655 domain-containing protein [Tahibacter amnicola]MCU7370314.1 DUF5655 domain-containing protein [Paucibacter sp. O1-1]MDA3825299.1 DUF5655 domain-containing protein [Paucibacter sp. O1-1]UXI65956.1 DUF5655 domain-containing protein [Tahibacter amnicola]
MTENTPAVQHHFTDRAPVVRAIYDRLLMAVRQFGPVEEDPKKTSIHLNRNSAFAGVATRKEALVITVKSARDIDSPRVAKREQVSKSRWHIEVRLTDPAQVDSELIAWLREAYEISA